MWGGAMSGFTLLWGKILDSSIWIKETKETRLLWITMMAMKDKDGRIQSSLIGLADRAKIKPEECRAALKVLLSPDPDDTSGVEEGRRVREIPGGWEIVNHDMYRFSSDAKREFWRIEKAEQRAREQEEEKARKKEFERRRKRASDLGKQKGGQQALQEGLQEAANADMDKRQK